MNERETMNVEEAAKFLGIGRNQCYEAINRGEIPAIRIGKRYLIPTAKLKGLLESVNYKPAQVPDLGLFVRKSRIQEPTVGVNFRIAISEFNALKESARYHGRSISAEIRARLQSHHEIDRWPS